MEKTGGTDGIAGLILYTGPRAELERKLRERDDEITRLETALDDVLMALDLPGDHCELAPAVERAKALLLAKARPAHAAAAVGKEGT